MSVSLEGGVPQGDIDTSVSTEVMDLIQTFGVETHCEEEFDGETVDNIVPGVVEVKQEYLTLYGGEEKGEMFQVINVNPAEATETGIAFDINLEELVASHQGDYLTITGAPLDSVSVFQESTVIKQEAANVQEDVTNMEEKQVVNDKTMKEQMSMSPKIDPSTMEPVADHTTAETSTVSTSVPSMVVQSTLNQFGDTGDTRLSPSPRPPGTPPSSRDPENLEDWVKTHYPALYRVWKKTSASQMFQGGVRMLCSTCVTRKYVGFNNGLPLCEKDRKERRVLCTVCRLRPSSGFQHGVAMCEPDYQFLSKSLGSSSVFGVCPSSCPPSISSSWCHYCRLTACISAKGFRFTAIPPPQSPPSSPEPLHVTPRLNTGTAHTSNPTHNVPTNPLDSPTVPLHPSHHVSFSSSPPVPSFRVKPYANPSSHTWTPRPRLLSYPSMGDPPPGNLPSSPLASTQHENLTQEGSAVFSRGRTDTLPSHRATNTLPSSSNGTHRYYDGSKLGLPNPGRKKRQDWDPAWVKQQQERYLAHHLNIYRQRRLENGAAQSSHTSSRS